jgi:Ras-related protein Rab-32
MIVFVGQWLDDLRDKVTLPDGSPVPVVLLVNKCDVMETVPNDCICWTVVG